VRRLAHGQFFAGSTPKAAQDIHGCLANWKARRSRTRTASATCISRCSDSVDGKIAARIGSGQKLTNSRGGESAVHTWNIPEVFGRTNAAERGVLEHVLKTRRTERRRTFGDADPVNRRQLTNKFSVQEVSSLLRKGYLKDMGRYVDLTHTFNGKYRRQQISMPSRTVDTRYGDPQLFLHPTESRPFTVREAARVQGFPDEFVFSGSTRQQFRMIGNAVPPPVGSAVARLAKSLLG
jgi:DNA (cytosine-5)-methyltransferase 1